MNTDPSNPRNDPYPPTPLTNMLNSIFRTKNAWASTSERSCVQWRMDELVKGAGSRGEQVILELSVFTPELAIASTRGLDKNHSARGSNIFFTLQDLSVKLFQEGGTVERAVGNQIRIAVGLIPVPDATAKAGPSNVAPSAPLAPRPRPTLADLKSPRRRKAKK